MRARFASQWIASWLILFPSCLSWASERALVAVDGATPPYIMSATHSGWTQEIIQRALDTQGVVVKFAYIPGSRIPNAFNSGEVDIVTLAKPDGTWKGYLTSWPVVRFHNQVMTLRAKLPKLTKIRDLTPYRVVSFQNAAKYLGTEYASMVAQNSRYKEFAGHLPSRMLFADRTDAVVSEPNVFKYWLSVQSKYFEQEIQQVAYHDILGPGNLYWFAFKSDSMRIKFEQGMAELYRRGIFEVIYEKYRKLYMLDRTMYQPLDCQFLRMKRPKDCP